MKTTFSHGDWEIRRWKDDDYPNGTRVSIDCEGHCIANSPRYYESQKEFEANFRAISRVPEMIELLLEMQRTLDVWLHTFAPDFYSPDISSRQNVREAQEEVKENGGIISYITDKRIKIEELLQELGYENE